MAEIRNYTINFGPQHPSAHGVLRLVLELAELALDVWDDSAVHVAADLAEALEMAVTLADEEPPGAVGIVVTGSVITVADAKRLLGRG